MSATTDKLEGNWNQIKGQLKQKYAILTEDDLLYIKGKEDEFLGRIQEKTGIEKQEIIDLINKF